MASYGQFGEGLCTRRVGRAMEHPVRSGRDRIAGAACEWIIFADNGAAVVAESCAEIPRWAFSYYL
jgi:hypothetical protein